MGVNEEAHPWGKPANVVESIYTTRAPAPVSVGTSTGMSNNNTFQWFKTTVRVR